MYQRTAKAALRGLNGTASSVGNSCIKQFSTTPRQNLRALPTPTENAKLNEILNVIQDKIILPAYLPQKQRRIVFNPKKKGYLSQNPIDIEVEGHEHRFQTLNSHKDIPDARKQLYDAIDTMESKEDWANVGTILWGYRKAGVRLNQRAYDKIIRLACDSGNVGMVIGCLKQAHLTGMWITEREQVIRIVNAINARWDGSLEQAKQASSWVRTLVDIIQRPENAEEVSKAIKKRQLADSGLGMSPHFSVLGRTAMLQTRAVTIQAKTQVEESVEDDLVALKDDLATVQTLWAPQLKEGKALAENAELAQARPSRQAFFSLNGSEYVKSLAWSIRGIRTSQQVAEEAAAPLLPLVDNLEQYAREFIQSEAGNEARAEQWTKCFEEALDLKASS